MRSTFHGLEVAKRGLYAQQTGINTTAHNIANANTQGYTRQRVNFTASSPIEVPAMNRSVAPGQLGTGVNFSSIVRLREKFLDDQFRNEAHSYGYWHIQKDTLEKIEMIFNEPSDDGLRSTIDQFWNAWSDLSREPDNLTARAVVRERAFALLDAFKHVDTKLGELQKDLEVSFEAKVWEANGYIEQIAQLNKEIRRIEGMGMNANDLRDQRDLLVDELARLVPIEVVEEQEEGKKGMYNIKLLHGGDEEIMLVEGIESNTIGLEDQNVVYQAVTENGISGELHSLWKARTETVETYREQLEALFANIIEAVNSQHEDGFDLNGDEDISFFTLIDGASQISIQEVEVNPEIVADLNRIAASSRSDAVGNGENALAISQLRDQFNEEYRVMMGQLGVQTQEAQRQASNSQIILEAVDYRRQSVSGVSLDEEMVNLVQLQHAYNASARMVTAIDQMLETIINRMGVVGR
ncbi:flagellar hook-associated protein 1 FlgK [Caldalkalibacillus uzonensis]|uniref:Flagellar hook-associated protein 1 n=1 Tax=Caldalkalibacillus uzonensis TaxID=353224 RepID=A0ABU0CWK4_9BACI|nr:flagellar hook-associated protein FlgK [Caldalkalibacillus uzonensis]MDQ0339900.1 flagellar hook-associated protein 1 FlgK [Caldalkalibacillus uzonensis]